MEIKLCRLLQSDDETDTVLLNIARKAVDLVISRA
jgi:hypothetical protein